MQSCRLQPNAIGVLQGSIRVLKELLVTQHACLVSCHHHLLKEVLIAAVTWVFFFKMLATVSPALAVTTQVLQDYPRASLVHLVLFLTILGQLHAFHVSIIHIRFRGPCSVMLACATLAILCYSLGVNLASQVLTMHSMDLPIVHSALRASTRLVWHQVPSLLVLSAPCFQHQMQAAKSVLAMLDTAQNLISISVCSTTFKTSQSILYIVTLAKSELTILLVDRFNARVVFQVLIPVN